MKYLNLLLLILVPYFSYSDDCSRPVLFSSLLDLNTATVDDSEIVTEDDLKFCPGQNLNNAELEPEDLPDNGSLWRVGNRRWNDDWEKKYQAWVKENVGGDFFEKINLSTDCADAAIAIRAIFARIYNLPASFAGNKLTNNSKDYSGLESVKTWDEENWREDFKRDERFKEALNIWMMKAGTVNLAQDTYQIKIWDEENKMPDSCVSPGTVVLSKGHAEFLTYKEESLFPYRISSSTMPSAVRPLGESIYSFYPAGYYEKKSDQTSRGYVWWNWVINCKKKFIKVKDEKMPYYSKQQSVYASKEEQPDLQYDFNKVYQEQLGLSDEEMNKRLMSEIDLLVAELELKVEERIIEVEKAEAYCAANGIDSALDCFYPVAKKTYNGVQYTLKINERGLVETSPNPYTQGAGELDVECEGCPPPIEEHLQANYLIETMNFEEFFKPKSTAMKDFYHKFSTPNRDERLRSKMNAISGIVYSLPYQDQQNEVFLKLLDKKVEVGNGKKISYYHLLQMHMFSPQPWDSKELRWGEPDLYEKYHYFKHNNKESLATYEELKAEYAKNPSEETEAKLEKYKEENPVLVKENEVFKEYFGEK